MNRNTIRNLVRELGEKGRIDIGESVNVREYVDHHGLYRVVTTPPDFSGAAWRIHCEGSREFCIVEALALA